MLVSEKSCVFCDDVREELNSKLSLIGIYVNDINIHADQMPAGINKLCAVSFLKGLDKRKKYKIVIEQPGQEDREVDLSEHKFESENFNPVAVAMAPFVMTEEGVLKVFLKAGKDKQLIGELKLNLVPLSKAQ